MIINLTKSESIWLLEKLESFNFTNSGYIRNGYAMLSRDGAEIARDIEKKVRRIVPNEMQVRKIDGI